MPRKGVGAMAYIVGNHHIVDTLIPFPQEDMVTLTKPYLETQVAQMTDHYTLK